MLVDADTQTTNEKWPDRLLNARLKHTDNAHMGEIDITHTYQMSRVARVIS